MVAYSVTWGEKTINFLHYNPFLLPTSFCFQVSSLVMLNHDLGREVAITGNQVLQAQADPCSFDLEPILRRWTAHKEHRSTAISRKGQVTSAAISGAQPRGCREGRETFQISKGMMWKHRVGPRTDGGFIKLHMQIWVVSPSFPLHSRWCKSAWNKPHTLPKKRANLLHCKMSLPPPP